jgi:hypothetical protein
MIRNPGGPSGPRTPSQQNLAKAREDLAAETGKTVPAPANIKRKSLPQPDAGIPLQPLRTKLGRDATPHAPSPLGLAPRTPGTDFEGVGGRIYPSQLHGSESRLNLLEQSASTLRPAGTPETGMDLPLPATTSNPRQDAGKWSLPSNTAVGKTLGLTAITAGVFGPAIYGTVRAIQGEIASKHPSPAPQVSTPPTATPTASVSKPSVAMGKRTSEATASSMPTHITIPGEKPISIALPGGPAGSLSESLVPLTPATPPHKENGSGVQSWYPPGAVPPTRVPDPPIG